MMMVPGTLDELNRIKDLKEAKDTWREDGNKMYDSMNALLKTMESMKSDVSSVKGGLANLDQARGTVSANRKQIEALSTGACRSAGGHGSDDGHDSVFTDGARCGDGY